MVDTEQETRDKIDNINIDMLNTITKYEEKIQDLKQKQIDIINFINDKISIICIDDDIDEIKQSLMEMTDALEDV
jgi:hypothetical protein